MTGIEPAYAVERPAAELGLPRPAALRRIHSIQPGSHQALYGEKVTEWRLRRPKWKRSSPPRCPTKKGRWKLRPRHRGTMQRKDWPMPLELFRLNCKPHLKDNSLWTFIGIFLVPMFSLFFTALKLSFDLFSAPMTNAWLFGCEIYWRARLCAYFLQIVICSYRNVDFCETRQKMKNLYHYWKFIFMWNMALKIISSLVPISLVIQNFIPAKQFCILFIFWNMFFFPLGSATYIFLNK